MTDKADKAGKPEADADDDLHKKFREALDRKKSNDDHPGVTARKTGVGDAHNDKVQRQFRRKSG